jgi:hypothetical protein
MVGQARIKLHKYGIDKIQFNCNHQLMSSSGENQAELGPNLKVKGSWS